MIPTAPHADTLRCHSTPLTPLPSGVAPRLSPLPGIKAVIFDIYGTLFQSAAGDFSGESDSRRNAAMREAIESEIGFPIPDDSASFHDLFFDLIRIHRERRRAEGVEHPEVEIREVWRDLLYDRATKIRLPGPVLDPHAIERIAVAYECAANPVWPMPGSAETIAELRKRRLALGLVSNAQFHTLALFPAFFDGRDLNELGFDPGLQIFSFKLLEGKPSLRLYEALAETLASQGIRPPDALYIGNDLRNDIWPAQALGFRTALFAGDARSLRWREDDPRLANVEPDLVLTDLRQVMECLAK